ncbi:hypothetical protein [Piscinibacter sp. XHJ-5]|uniref:hypothetical protein n=1 Tax=Piscinibacter sp. XHJ-5 TaxID=3037797 RepID=UPI0024534B0B|nr:hypothetical protein [Piscinibacter sp. XHJ-5]
MHGIAVPEIGSMKFVGGTHHGQDVPIALRVVIHATGRRGVEVDHLPAGGAPGGAPRAILPGGSCRESYRVVVWREPDGRKTKFLARTGLTHDEIERMATRLFMAS